MAFFKSVFWAFKFLVILGFAMLVGNIVFGWTLFTPLVFSYPGFLTGALFILFMGLFIYF